MRAGATPPASFAPAGQVADLVGAASHGDARATATLLRAVAPKVAAAVNAVIGARHPDRDDVVQQALLGFVQALTAFRGDCSLIGYARVIGVRTAIAARKRARARAVTEDTELELDALPERRSSPADALAAEERKELLRELLSELPAEQAETLALRVIFGLSLDEVATETCVPLNTVRSRLRLAKERLKARIGADPALVDALGAS